MTEPRRITDARSPDTWLEREEMDGDFAGSASAQWWIVCCDERLYATAWEDSDPKIRKQGLAELDALISMLARLRGELAGAGEKGA